MITFKGKVAIITGGASGIGKSLAELLARKGAYVVVADINVNSGNDVVNSIHAEGGKACFQYIDVTDESMVNELVQKTYDAHGHLDFMFNNAGISSMSEFYNITSDQWKRMININLLGVVYGANAAYKLMKKQGYGYIVNTSSAAAFGPTPLTASYGATKHAVLALTTSLHYEAEDFGVKVSAVCPAFVTTSISQTMDMSDFDRGIFNKNQKSYISSEKCAEIIVRGIEKQKLIITTVGLKKTTDIFFTLFPRLHRKLMKYIVKVGRSSKIHVQ